MIEAPAGGDLAPDFEVDLFLGIVTVTGSAPAWHGRGTDLVHLSEGKRAPEPQGAA